MDQTLVNWLFGGFGAAVGWVLKVIWDAIKELKADMKQIERNLPEVYVRKDDFRVAVKDMQDDIREVKSDMKEGLRGINDTLGLIFKKLDRKEDKE